MKQNLETNLLVFISITFIFFLNELASHSAKKDWNLWFIQQRKYHILLHVPYHKGSRHDSSITSSKRVPSVISCPLQLTPTSVADHTIDHVCVIFQAEQPYPSRRTSPHHRPWRSWRPRKQIITREGTTCPRRRRRPAIRWALDFLRRRCVVEF
jgi:hypothetical protein